MLNHIIPPAATTSAWSLCLHFWRSCGKGGSLGSREGRWGERAAPRAKRWLCSLTSEPPNHLEGLVVPQVTSWLPHLNQKGSPDLPPWRSVVPSTAPSEQTGLRPPCSGM